LRGRGCDANCHRSRSSRHAQTSGLPTGPATGQRQSAPPVAALAPFGGDGPVRHQRMAPARRQRRGPHRLIQILVSSTQGSGGGPCTPLDHVRQYYCSYLSSITTLIVLL